MAERIYTRAERGRLEPLEEKPFSTEDELQALIAEYPELLDGEQIPTGRPAALDPHQPREGNRRNF